MSGTSQKDLPIQCENLDQMKQVWTRPDTLIDCKLHYCPGCGHSVVHRLIMEVIQELNIQGETIGVAPVGCSVFAYQYMDIDMQEAAHGRATAVATGIKRVRPDRIVFTYQGDGDLAAIGTAETIHTINRGENIVIRRIRKGAEISITGTTRTMLVYFPASSKLPTECNVGCFSNFCRYKECNDGHCGYSQ